MYKKYCTQCGAQLNDADQFCTKCGQKQHTNIQSPADTRYLPPQNNTVYMPSINMQPVPNSGNMANNMTSYASSTTGQMMLGGNIIPGDIGALPTVGAEVVTGPIGSFFSGGAGVFSGLISLLTHPKAIIPAVLYGAMLFFARKLGTDDTIGKILSWVTYSGGMDRTGPGILTGIIGVGTVGAAFSSLFFGGIGRTVKGVKSLFTNNISFGSILTGMGLSAIWYKMLTGLSPEGLPVAVSGIFMLLQAVTMNKGYINTVCAAFSRLKSNGTTLVSAKRYKSVIIGAMAGIAVPAALSSSFEYSYVLPLIIMVIGGIFRLISKPKDTRLAGGGA